MTETPNKFLHQSSTGAEVGTWGTPYNHNMTMLDNFFGGMVTIDLSGGGVVLSSAQYQNQFFSFTGALGGDAVVQFPSVGSFYSVRNLTTNSSLFNVILASTTGGHERIGVPVDGEFVDIMTDGLNVKFRNLGRIGSYIDLTYLSSPVGLPPWITICTVPPYLYCNGAAFSSATYPVLTTMLGGTTLPDCRGRIRFALDGGTNRNTTFMSGDTLLALGGVEQVTYLSSNTDVTFIAELDPAFLSGFTVPFGSYPLQTAANVAEENIPSVVVQGITMIRAG